MAQLMPSRTDVPEYREYLERIEALVAVVNHRHGTPDWMPIQLKLRDDLEEAMAAYRHYDVHIVNAMFDGMNLVAKEGPIVNERNGVSILSENTGAHEELGEFALTVNPFDVQALANAIHRAFTMSDDERAHRADGLREIVLRRDPGDWIDEQLVDVRRKTSGATAHDAGVAAPTARTRPHGSSTAIAELPLGAGRPRGPTPVRRADVRIVGCARAATVGVSRSGDGGCAPGSEPGLVAATARRPRVVLAVRGHGPRDVRGAEGAGGGGRRRVWGGRSRRDGLALGCDRRHVDCGRRARAARPSRGTSVGHGGGSPPIRGPLTTSATVAITAAIATSGAHGPSGKRDVRPRAGAGSVVLCHRGEGPADRGILAPRMSRRSVAAVGRTTARRGLWYRRPSLPSDSSYGRSRTFIRPRPPASRVCRGAGPAEAVAWTSTS